MTILKHAHDLYTYDFYLRASYYHARGQDLYERFRQLVAVFPEITHIRHRLDDIEKDVLTFDKPPKILVYGNCDLELSEIVVSMEPARMSVQPHNGNGVTIVVIYVEIDRLDNEGMHVIETVINGCKETIVKDRIFVSCRVRSIDGIEDEDRLRQNLNTLLHKQFGEEGPWDDQLIISPKDGRLGDKISNYLEKELLTGFDKMQNYLQRFQTSVRPNVNGAIFDQPVVSECLSEFVSNKWYINDIINQREMKAEPTLAGLPADDRYLVFITEELSSALKCAIANPLALKYNLPLWLCSDMLTGMKSDLKIREALSIRTKSTMKRLFRFREKEDGYKAPAKTDKHEYMVDLIKRDLSKPFLYIERILKNTREMTVIVEKMIFEISGYFKQSVVWKTEQQKLPESYHVMKEAILNVDHVYGVGTIYGQLEVHLKTEDPEAESQIGEILKRYMYTKPCIIKVIEREPTQLADQQHLHGKMIHVYQPGDNKKRTGTLGGFVEDSDKTHLYAVTCAHVVRTRAGDQDVFLEERQQDRRLGISREEMALNPGDVPQMDIAAVQVGEDIRNQCVRFVKAEDQLIKLSELAAPDDAVAFAASYVYKFGSATDLTRGIVCSEDYMLKAQNTVDLRRFVILIESLPANTSAFATKGDSGSWVCLPTPDSDKITVLSLLTSGDFKLKGEESTKCFTFLLKNGLQEIARKSGKELVLCTL